AATLDPQEALHAGGGQGREHHRALATLVVGEVALSLVLLLCASLVLRGFRHLTSSDPGFDPEPVLTFSMSAPADEYPGNSALQGFIDPALAAIRRVPGVAAAGAISALPYEAWGINFRIRYAGQPADNFERRPLAEYRIVTPGFFAVTRQRLLAGRLLDVDDDAHPGAVNAAVVNEALAMRDFPGRSPIGHRFYTGDSTFATIVGVVSDIRNAGPLNPPQAEVYGAAGEFGVMPASTPVMVRTRGQGPTAVEAAVRAAVRSVDPRAAISDMRPMTVVIAQSVGQPRFYLDMLAAFASVALVLAVAGVYGVMSYAVAQRRREFGIRKALGSPGARIIALVGRQGLLIVGLGALLGLVAGAATVPLLRQLLYGVSPADGRGWLMATITLVVAGVVASLVPALRAARVDPLTTMRGD
ncbi:MAG TPA: FtsX-like permease family protein, partial [Gemmatimonadaceae bacterium]|nr:FtsX-like permease family protein [Gemmatimonadaceae bacterium]